MNAPRLVPHGAAEAVELFGPTVEFLSLPAGEESACVLKGTIPPGVCVPLHSHPDPECFFVLSGAVEVFAGGDGGHQWLHAGAGDFIDIPGGARHAFRNRAAEPAAMLITTTARLGRFFQEVGRPAGAPLPPPTPDELRRFAEAAARHGHWLGSPQENTALGIAFGN